MARISKSLQQAIDALEISDVYLRSTESHCHEDFDPKFSPDLENLLVQHMHVVTACVQLRTEDGNERENLLRVFIKLGVRWVEAEFDTDEDASLLDVKALIEAEFIAEYHVSEPLPKKSIDEFALKNASYHVWPYWREYLSTQCERMRLPRITLPITQFSKPANKS